jgi:esterase/lipase superfamily enzyme
MTMRNVSLVIALLIAGLVGGCGGRATGVMRPVEANVEGATKVPLLVATTRRVSPDDGLLFSGERGRLSFAEVTVSLPPGHKPGEIEWPDRFPGDPTKHFVTTAVERFDENAFRSRVRAAVAKSGRKHVLLFVHGYNNMFDDAVYRFAQITHDTNAGVVPILFTWPSRGSLLAYTYDRESSNYSRDAMEGILRSLAAEPSVKEVSILAHSMGNWVTLEALRQMAIRDRRVAPKIRNVMLAAPDVDVEVARTQIAGMGPTRPHFTLFTSQDDRALAFSRRLWGSTARLGAIDPTQEPYKSALARYKIDAYDLTTEQGTDNLNHGKFAESPEVVRFIGAQLASGQEITSRGAGLGDQIGVLVAGAASTVGTAATIAVSAPIAIVDRKTRDNLTDRIGAIAGQNEDSSDLVLSEDLPVRERAQPNGRSGTRAVRQ